MEALEQRCRVLTVENETLKAEVEIYRNETAALRPSAATSALETTTRRHQNNEKDHFVKLYDLNNHC